MKSQPINSLQFLVFVLLFWAIVFGAYVRISAVALAGFPVNDGGMFYQMTQDLLDAGFRLPLSTSYNQLDIPYAYPPLAFYLAGIIAQAGVSLIEVVRWLPVFFSLLTIPAFFWLARLLAGDVVLAALATMLFALLPRAFEWLIMGGGLSRAPGALFFMLFSACLLLVFRDRRSRAILPAIIFGGLVVLTHPERSLHAVVTGALIWLYFDRTRRGFGRAALIGLGVFAISALWWGPVIARFGLEPFMNVLAVGGNRLLFWAPMLLLNFTDERIPLVAIFAAIGFIAALVRKDWFLPIWTTLTFLADPRSAAHVVPVQASLLAAAALSQIFFAGLMGGGGLDWADFINRRRGRLALGYILILMLVNGQLGAIQLLSAYQLAPAERDALVWVSQNTPPDSRFLVYSQDASPALSPLLEWFPTLSQRHSISTYQGREWLGGADSYQYYWDNLEAWNACLYQDAACLDNWSAASAVRAEYIYFSLGPVQRNSSLAQSLLHSRAYAVVYQTDTVLIFQSNQP